MRKWRKNNPLKCRFNWIKDRAKRLNQPFTITFEDFLLLEEVSGPITSRHHIDRIVTIKGYVHDNIQVLIKRDNIAKSNRERVSNQYEMF